MISYIEFHTIYLNSIQFDLNSIELNCIQCHSILSFERNLIFTKSIHFFSSIDELNITRSAQQHGAQVKIYKYLTYLCSPSFILWLCNAWSSMFVHNPIAIASKHKCTKTNPTHHHDASFSTIANGPLYHWLKRVTTFSKTPLQVSNRYGFPKKKIQLWKKNHLKKKFN